MNQLLTTDQASKAVGLSRWYLYRNWHRIGGARRAGRSLRWDLQELEAWMKAQAEQQAKIRESLSLSS